MYYNYYVDDLDLLLAALSAGAEFQRLRQSGRHGLPLRKAVVLSSAEWEDFTELLPAPESLWEPEDDNDLGSCVQRRRHGVFVQRAVPKSTKSRTFLAKF